ncbi:hypothetical protein [Alteromonas sp. 1_MG-2023]|uniref:hypothetical protein n=1 Tax=Alteromonas sp. 1_MG-2023 TaxID=3062669 RepID=UPI0026E241AD|nr:hypothetical protein [Alteromonas sp. 1_MG-2023]
MGKFKEAMETMAAGIKDLSKLDVVTFEGSVTLKSEGADGVAPLTFAKVMSSAMGNPEVAVKVLASTQTSIDGDIVAFYDTDITEAQRLVHAELVLAGAASRAASIEFVKSIFDDISEF